MSISTIKANEIINLLKQGEEMDSVKSHTSKTKEEWYNYSSKAYNINLANSKKERKEIIKRKNVSATSNEEISVILTLNEVLADYALLLPIFSTMNEVLGIQKLSETLPNSESEIIKIIGKKALHPKLRVLQKKGCLEQFEYFKIFSKMFDAAVLSFYRTNFISCYLTLLPIIEGVIIRWMGYNESGVKPDFEDIRKFFKNSAQRQPCPNDILFHNVYVKACDKILNNHFYKPTTSSGISYANFNRHIASHLLNDDHFGTKENCIRLFILVDAMTEIYVYENKIGNPRFNLKDEQINDDIATFVNVILDNTQTTAEHSILGTDFSDLENYC